MDFNSAEFDKLLLTIRSAYGYDFTDYAEASVRRRVTNFMQSRKIETLQMLEKSILANELHFEEFIQEVSVTVTEMFRDPLFYNSLREKIMKRLASYPLIKVWVAGCATGEEVYSIAILLKEEGLLNRSLIYATDLNQKSLEIAKAGIFPLDKMKNYTSNYQKAGGKESFSEYYNAKYNAAIMDRSLKENLVFAPHNLAVDKSFNEFQLILCRNVLIYFNQNLQNNVFNLFYESLCPFGFLGLGNKESLLFSDRKKQFDEIDRKEKIYMKKG